MAKQVRPQPAKPISRVALQVRESDRGAGWRNPSGTVSIAHTRSPDVRVQSLPVRQNELIAWQSGGVHVRDDANRWILIKIKDALKRDSLTGSTCFSSVFPLY